MSNFKTQSGNAVVAVLVVLVIVAVGGLVFMSNQMNAQSDAVAATGATSTQTAEADPEASTIQVRPGNPVVAKVSGQDVTRLEVFSLIQNLPPNARQMPVQKLFPVAMEQVINNKIVAKKVDGVNLDNDPEVKKQLEIVKGNIVRSVFLQNEVKKRLTDERLQGAYDQYVAQFPQMDEVRASHILVKEESEAKDIFQQIQDGADFAALATEKSIDGTSNNGGDLGYFLKEDVVPEFGEVAFATAPGSLAPTPVKSKFGYHIIKVEDKRKRQPPPFEQARSFLEGQLQQVALEELMTEWRRETSIERFDINGDAIEPAAGDAQASEAQ